MEVLLALLFALVLVVFGFGALARVAGPRTAAIYWGGIHWVGRQVVAFGNWAWTNHYEFVLGVLVGVMLTLMAMSP